MTAAFRADASNQIGTGHVMRCLALAEALRARGVQPRFFCRDRPGHLMETIRERSFPVIPLPALSGPEAALPDGDARQTADAIGDTTPDWMVVDHYGIDAAWERRLQPRVGRLLVIDDLANRPHECQLLLDQNYSVEGERRYASLVPESCGRLIGPAYALLAGDYARQRHDRTGSDDRTDAIQRVLVYFGGADASNMTGETMKALSAPEYGHLTVDLVIGANHPCRDALEAQAHARPGTHVYGTRSHLADLMAGADVAIGAGGVTTWERMCIGLPAIVVCIADNQRPACEALAADGLIHYVGDAAHVRANDIREALGQLIGDRHRLTELGRRGQALVDGRGAERVAAIMIGPTDDLQAALSRI